MAFRLTLYDFSGEAAWSSDELAPLTVRSLRDRLAVHLKRPVALLQIFEDKLDTVDTMDTVETVDTADGDNNQLLLLDREVLDML